ncbi:MAG: thioredoxin [Bacilli bacterium]|jgi:thioredoxin 1
MKLINLNDNNLTEFTKEGLTLVDFYADWCGPCKMLNPILEQFAHTNEDVRIVKVNVDQFTNLAAQYKVMTIPTLILFKEGEPISTKSGFQSKEMLKKWLNENK